MDTWAHDALVSVAGFLLLVANALAILFSWSDDDL
jgi:hypothetical protein